MDITSLVLWIIIGGFAGWIAGIVMRGGGFGLIGNVVVGILGAVLGGFVFDLLGIAAGSLLGSLVLATLGAIMLLFLVGLVKKG